MQRDIVIAGFPCAGKTTSGLYLRSLGYEHVEASIFMRRLFDARKPSSTLPEFAESVLATDPEFVPRSLLASVDIGDGPLVVTGLRSPEEIAYLRMNRRSGRALTLLVLEGTEELRFSRSRQRNRTGDPSTFAEFLLKDAQQLRMGLSHVLADISARRIQNEGSLFNLYASLRTIAS